MKNNILIFLLGIFVTISIAATVPNTGLFTIKPATPKSVVVETFYMPSQAKFFIKQKIREGYIYKSAYAESSYWLIVMEKY